jgi:hypothetical protein
LKEQASENGNKSAQLCWHPNRLGKTHRSVVAGLLNLLVLVRGKNGSVSWEIKVHASPTGLSAQIEAATSLYETKSVVVLFSLLPHNNLRCRQSCAPRSFRFLRVTLLLLSKPVFHLLLQFILSQLIQVCESGVATIMMNIVCQKINFSVSFGDSRSALIFEAILTNFVSLDSSPKVNYTNPFFQSLFGEVS